MEFKRLGRCSEQVSGEETEALLADVHLRELVCERTDSRLLVHRPLPEPWLVDVLRLRLRSSIVRRLSWLAYLLLCELALGGETGSEELRRLCRLARHRTVRGTRRRCNRVRAVVRLRLAGCILPTFCVMLAWRWGGGRDRVQGALRVKERLLPLRPPRRGF